MGCILFQILFFQHPFKNATKLSIASAKFEFPEDGNHSIFWYSENLEILIRNLLVPNPKNRPVAADVYNIFKSDSLQGFREKKLTLSNEAKKILIQQIKTKIGQKNKKLDFDYFKKVGRLLPTINYVTLKKNFKQEFLDQLNIKPTHIKKFFKKGIKIIKRKTKMFR